MRRYFAMMDTEQVKLLGSFDNVDEAFERADEMGSSVWVFDEASLRALVDSAQCAMGEGV